MQYWFSNFIYSKSFRFESSNIDMDSPYLCIWRCYRCSYRDNFELPENSICGIIRFDRMNVYSIAAPSLETKNISSLISLGIHFSLHSGAMAGVTAYENFQSKFHYDQVSQTTQKSPKRSNLLKITSRIMCLISIRPICRALRLMPYNSQL